MVQLLKGYWSIEDRRDTGIYRIGGILHGVYRIGGILKYRE